MRLHLNKPGIRALGVAESFRQGQTFSILAGVVMRSDLVVDGVSVGRADVGGDNATASIAGLFSSLRRNDINLVMVSGAILSLYNILDVDSLSRRTRLPVVCMTYKETRGIEEAIRRHFPLDAERKLEAYRGLGKRKAVRLRSGHRVFVRTSGVSPEEVKPVLDAFTLQGSIPEPVRLAKMVARAVLVRRP